MRFAKFSPVVNALDGIKLDSNLSCNFVLSCIHHLEFTVKFTVSCISRDVLAMELMLMKHAWIA